jgi:hypothetical protein
MPSAPVELPTPALSASLLAPTEEDEESRLPLAVAPPALSPGGRSDDDAWDAARRALVNTVRQGLLGIGAPTRMRQGSSAIITVTVSPDPFSTDVLREALSGNAQVAIRPSDVSPVMRVTCAGAGFTVTPLSAEDQLTIDTATWKFQARAEQAGKRTLFVTAHLRLADADAWLSRLALTHEMHVSVAPVFIAGRLWRGNWQWAVGSVLGAAGTITTWQTLIGG